MEGWGGGGEEWWEGGGAELAVARLASTLQMWGREPVDSDGKSPQSAVALLGR